MPRGRPKPTLKLKQADREKLELIARRPKTSQRAAQRAGIILACARGMNNGQVAAASRVSAPTVGKWRARYIAQGIESLGDAPRSGAPRRITDRQVEAVITKTLEQKPEAATQWSTRLMAREVELSHNTIKRIWQTFGLQPHRERPSSSPAIRSLWKRCATSCAFTSTLRNRPAPLCFAWMRKVRCKLWSAASPFCR